MAWYAFIGLGLTESRSWLYSTSSGTAVDSNGYHSDRGVFFINRPMTEAVIPVGLGFSYELYDEVDLVLEYSFHAINTDKLDVWISNNAKLEGFGFFSLGMNVSFQTPKNWSFRRGLPRYNGKSSDPAIRAYNKRKRVVMTSKRQQRYASKKRYSHKRKRIKRRRRLNLSR